MIAPAALFSPPRSSVWLEIGFGGGEHLAGQAAVHPEIGFIGCEVFVNGVAALLGQLDRLALSNVRIFNDDARLLLPALPEACIDRAFLLFPDPWPKRRHAGRRFIVPGNLAQMARILADGAELLIASDDAGYIRWSLAQLGDDRHFEWQARSAADWRRPPPGWISTRYQQKAERAGRPPIFLRFRRRPQPA